MTIETKFNLGDKVYVLFNNFIRVGFIIKVIVQIETDPCYTLYRVQVTDQESCIYNENDIHATKEDLCKYLSMYVN